MINKLSCSRPQYVCISQTLIDRHENLHAASDDVKGQMLPGSATLCSLRFKGAVRWYTVDLDLPPSKRWEAVISDKKAEVSCSVF